MRVKQGSAALLLPSAHCAAQESPLSGRHAPLTQACCSGVKTHTHLTCAASQKNLKTEMIPGSASLSASRSGGIFSLTAGDLLGSRRAGAGKKKTPREPNGTFYFESTGSVKSKTGELYQGCTKCDASWPTPRRPSPPPCVCVKSVRQQAVTLGSEVGGKNGEQEVIRPDIPACPALRKARRRRRRR